MASSPAYSPRSRSECSPAHHHTDGRVEGSPPRLSLSPRDESVDGVAVGAGIIGNDGPTGNRPRSSMRAMEDVINLLSGSAEGGGRGQLAVTSSSSANCSPRVNMDLEVKRLAHVHIGSLGMLVVHVRFYCPPLLKILFVIAIRVLDFDGSSGF